jgi:hypothetical protein
MGFFLSLESVKHVARLAYEARRLTAQHGGGCVFNEGDERTGEDLWCVIGAALPPIMNGPGQLCGTIEGLIAGGHVDVRREERGALLQLQLAHDLWASSVQEALALSVTHSGFDDVYRVMKTREATFRCLVDLDPPVPTADESFKFTKFVPAEFADAEPGDHVDFAA